jgi:hypothetical protein
MRDRAKRLGITALLTGVDAALLDKYFDLIWQTWSGDPWGRGAFLLLLALLAVSAAVLWIHVYYDLRQTMRERWVALFFKTAPSPGELRRDSDV